MTNTATPKQIEFIQALQAERVWFDMDVENMSQDECRAKDAENRPAFLAGVVVHASRKMWLKGDFDTRAASYLIEVLQKCDRKPEARPTVSAGRYAVPTEEGHLGFYRVADSKRSGRQFVLVQASDAEHRLSPSAALSVLRKIAEDPRAASLRYGREIGSCGVCGRTLTDEHSRAAGIGPVCAEKTGW